MIYLDHASATPVSEKVMTAMTPYFSEKFFNPSSPYLAAKEVRDAYESAKSTIAHAIGAKGTDLIITSGATESTNLAFTVLETGHKALVLATEHASVLNTAKKYNSELIKVTKTGIIDLKDLRQKITDDTALISVALVNNELGTIQPISEIAEIIENVRQNRLENGVETPLYLHTDASQALSLLNVNVARLKVDLMTLSAAKIYGPKGVGALYVARGIRLNPITEGGGQERGLRSGTENVPGVIGFAAAAESAKSHVSSNRHHYEKLRELFLAELKKNMVLLEGRSAEALAPAMPEVRPATASELDVPEGWPATVSRSDVPEVRPATALTSAVPEGWPAEGPRHPMSEANGVDGRNGGSGPRQNKPGPRQPDKFILLGPKKHQLASFIPLSFPGLDAERLIYELEDKEIYLSTGAACAANKGRKSHVLKALNLDDETIAGSLRISLGTLNNEKNVREAAREIAKVVAKEHTRLDKIRAK